MAKRIVDPEISRSPVAGPGMAGKLSGTVAGHTAARHDLPRALRAVYVYL